MRDDSQRFKVDDNALVICFIFLSLGIGSIFKEINKRYGVIYICYKDSLYTRIIFGGHSMGILF